MKSACTEKGHRRRALARARKCSTCRRDTIAWGELDGCIGCGELIDYLSCSPGYCSPCAHDPCWVPVEKVLR